MSPSAKTLIAMAIAFCVAILILACFNILYASGVMLSFVRGEAALLFLMGRAGLSQKHATTIVILCSSASICFYFWGADKLKKPVVEIIKKIIAEVKKSLGIKTVAVAVNEPAKDRHSTSPFYRIARKSPYCILPLYCFDPLFGVPSGIIFAMSLRLDMKLSLAILLLGNIAEKVVWSYFLHSIMHLIRHAAIPITLSALAAVAAFNIFRLTYLDHHNNNNPLV